MNCKCAWSVFIPPASCMFRCSKVQVLSRRSSWTSWSTGRQANTKSIDCLTYSETVLYACSDDVCTDFVRSATTLHQFIEVEIPLTPQHVSSDTCHNHQCAPIGNKTCEQHLEGIEGSVRQRLLHSLKMMTLQEDFLVLLIPYYTVIPEYYTIIPFIPV
jgi:hypothetical protein